MSPTPSAPNLMRGLGLEVDGPMRWGQRPTSSAAGVFIVETASPWPAADIDVDAVRRWLERVPDMRLDGERPTQTVLAARLSAYWLPDQSVLYIGRTTKSLGARVGSLYATELGHARPHPGGNWLKTLRDLSRLRVWWAETAAAEEYEDELIAAFAAGIDAEARGRLPQGAPVLPWANTGSPTGPTRETGLSGALLSVEESPAGTSAVRRSDRSETMRRRPASAAAARSPRRATPRPSGKASATAGREQPTHLTAEGLAAMEAELERLRTVERPQVVERVKQARELGDLRENADYEAARNEQSFLEGRILELEQKLRTASIIESPTGGSISLGSTVVYEVDGAEAQITIVGSTESDPSAGRISAVSPVGKALLGHRAGDAVVITTPSAQLRYRVIEVR